MIQQVLVVHPKSGKAHFVRAELYARQGKLDLARDSLASAENLSPGLPFAKYESSQALRSQLLSASGPRVRSSSAANYAEPATLASSSMNWARPLLLASVVIVAGYFIFRRRAPAPTAEQSSYTNQGGLSGPQSFGTGGSNAMSPSYPPQPGYPQSGYPPQAGSGLGGRIMGGVATGLAVGAGVMAAEAIGRNLMGNHNSMAGRSNNSNINDFQPINSNSDMGGANFGVDNSSSWDDAASPDVGSGGGWDT